MLCGICVVPSYSAAIPVYIYTRTLQAVYICMAVCTRVRIYVYVYMQHPAAEFQVSGFIFIDVCNITVVGNTERFGCC